MVMAVGVPIGCNAEDDAIAEDEAGLFYVGLGPWRPAYWAFCMLSV